MIDRETKRLSLGAEGAEYHARVGALDKRRSMISHCRGQSNVGEAGRAFVVRCRKTLPQPPSGYSHMNVLFRRRPQFQTRFKFIEITALILHAPAEMLVFENRDFEQVTAPQEQAGFFDHRTDDGNSQTS